MHSPKPLFAAATALLLSAPSIAESAQGVAGPRVASMDVAGVRLSMTRPQAEAALAGTYRCGKPTSGLSFAELVQNEVTKRRGDAVRWGQTGSGVASLDCAGPNRERLIVSFAQTPSGPVVDEVTLQAASAGLDLPAVRRQLAAKYGRPTIGGDEVGTRCDPGYRCGGGFLTQGPYLTVDSVAGLLIRMGRGDRAEEADKAAVMAAADRILPKRSGAAF